MEIFIKDKGLSQKINWFSSIPDKYRQEILDRLKQDRLKIDDPSNSQYQIILDLMGKDDQQMAKERMEKIEKMRQDRFFQEMQEKRRIEDGHASAFLVSQTGDDSESYKQQLLFTVPEHPKPKFLSKTSLLQQLLLKEAEQLDALQNGGEDNAFIFNEIMKNDTIREAFAQIRENYGEEAFELNKLSLLNFIKRGRQNFTYSVKYYGVDEGQIGILSRKVPFDEKDHGNNPPPIVLPRIATKKEHTQQRKLAKDLYEFVELEVSEDEVFTVEVTDDEEDYVPAVSKPVNNNLHIVQGTVNGKEFQNLQKAGDMQSLQDSQQVEYFKPKKMKKVQQVRRIKKKKQVKKLKESSIMVVDPSSVNPIVLTLNDTEQTQQLDNEQTTHTFQKGKDMMSTKAQQELYEDIHSNLQNLENLMLESQPFMINFRELFKRIELNNLKEFKKPQPEKYNQHIVHSYSLPKGLHALKRQQVLSESERFDQERYSKRNVQLQMIDKVYQKMNLGGQTYGLKGSKVKPIYFQINQGQSNSRLQTQPPLNTNTSSTMPDLIQNKTLKQTMSFTKLTNASSNNQSLNQNQAPVLGQKIIADESQTQKSSVRSQRDAPPAMISHFFQKPARLPPQPSQDETPIDEPSNNNLVNQSEQSVQNQAYQYYNFSRDTLNINNNNNNKSDQSSSQIAKNFTLGPGSLPFDSKVNTISTLKSFSNNNNNMNNQQNQATKKNNQIIKNLARNKKAIVAESSKNSNTEEIYQAKFDFKQAGIFDERARQSNIQRRMMNKNASEGNLMYGFQISNQMKNSYLMDTQKLLQNQIQTRLVQNDIDDEQEDHIIFKQEANKDEKKFQLPPVVKQTYYQSQTQTHPNITSSQYEKEVYLRIIKKKSESVQRNKISDLGSDNRFVQALASVNIIIDSDQKEDNEDQ